MKKMFCLLMALTMLLCVAFPCFAEESVQSVGVTVNLTGVAIAVIGLIFNFLLAWIGKAILPKVKEWLEAKTNTEQRKALWELVVKLVEAAEQVIGSGKGAEKLEFVRKKLYAAGYEFDKEMIEAAVKEMNDRSMKRLEEVFSIVLAEAIGETTEPTEPNADDTPEEEQDE